MGFLSSIKGLIKHEAVVTTSQSVPKNAESNQTVPNTPQSDQHISPQTHITTQRPAPSTPSPRAHA